MKRKVKHGTVVAAMRWTDSRGTRVVIGADSQLTVGNNRLILDPESKYSKKIIHFDGFCVGVCGVGPIRETLAAVQEDKNLSITDIDDPDKAAGKLEEFARMVFVSLRENLETSPYGSVKGMSQEVGPLLIVTRQSIFLAYPEFSFVEIPDYTATGCGADFALGAMGVLYDSLKESRKRVTPEMLISIINSSLDVAAKNSVYCAPPFYIVDMG